MLCVNDVDGRLLRVDCSVRIGGSNALNDEFNNDDDDANKPPTGSDANADGFVRLLSSVSVV